MLLVNDSIKIVLLAVVKYTLITFMPKDLSRVFLVLNNKLFIYCIYNGGHAASEQSENTTFFFLSAIF